ncbi:MAG TPA: Wzz/FepE/Etk N-terminal domain-containing protein, partial [Arachidicoccus sp.]
MQQYLETVEKKPETINLKAEILKYTRKWYWFVMGGIICVFLAFIYLRYATPVYHVSTELLIRDDKKGAGIGDMGSGSGAALSDLSLFKSNQSIYNELEVLSSKSLLQRVFSAMPQLQASVYIKDGLKTSEVYGN